MREEALIFATKSHEGQKRKYSGDDYIIHPIAVARIVENAGYSESMVCAALLHDTVEDCDVSIHDIYQKFGFEVASLVDWLTDVSVKEDGNRRVRKELDRQHTAQASPEAKTIKLADLIHNSESILECDPNFSKVYMSEANKLLDVLGEGDAGLFKIAQQIVNDYYFKTKVG